MDSTARKHSQKNYSMKNCTHRKFLSTDLSPVTFNKASDYWTNRLYQTVG